MVQRLIPPVTASKPQADAMFATLDSIVENLMTKKSSGQSGEFGTLLMQAIAEAESAGVVFEELPDGSIRPVTR